VCRVRLEKTVLEMNSGLKNSWMSADFIGSGSLANGRPFIRGLAVTPSDTTARYACSPGNLPCLDIHIINGNPSQFANPDSLE